jgi:hypothetical protein
MTAIAKVEWWQALSVIQSQACLREIHQAAIDSPDASSLDF